MVGCDDFLLAPELIRVLEKMVHEVVLSKNYLSSQLNISSRVIQAALCLLCI